MKYLLDSNMVTYYLEKHPRVVERLEAVPAGDRYLSNRSVVTRHQSAASSVSIT